MRNKKVKVKILKQEKKEESESKISKQNIEIEMLK